MAHIYIIIICASELIFESEHLVQKHIITDS